MNFEKTFSIPPTFSDMILSGEGAKYISKDDSGQHWVRFNGFKWCFDTEGAITLDIAQDGLSVGTYTVPPGQRKGINYSFCVGHDMRGLMVLNLR